MARNDYQSRSLFESQNDSFTPPTGTGFIILSILGAADITSTYGDTGRKATSLCAQHKLCAHATAIGPDDTITATPDNDNGVTRISIIQAGPTDLTRVRLRQGANNAERILSHRTATAGILTEVLVNSHTPTVAGADYQAQVFVLATVVALSSNGVSGGGLGQHLYLPANSQITLIPTGCQAEAILTFRPV